VQCPTPFSRGEGYDSGPFGLCQHLQIVMLIQDIFSFSIYILTFQRLRLQTQTHMVPQRRYIPQKGRDAFVFHHDLKDRIMYPTAFRRFFILFHPNFRLPCPVPVSPLPGRGQFLLHASRLLLPLFREKESDLFLRLPSF